MRFLNAAAVIGVLLFFCSDHGSGQAKTAKVFLLEDTASNQWCAYDEEAAWNTAVRDAGAMTVGTLTYSNDLLLRIDVTETDETGDWIVYDHYFLDDHGRIEKLSRMINVLPGDMSVSQMFSIRNGKAKKIATSEKQLSTGKPLTSPKPVWLPDLLIKTRTNVFPFSGLLEHSDLRTASKICTKALSQK